jgi:putative SOS response-associated peptidase YedK
MCGRFVSASPPDQVAAYFEAEATSESLWQPTFNVAPTMAVFAVRVDGSVRRLEPFRWGLVPFWAKDPSVGNRMINARAETLAGKSAYRRAFAKRRCLIPADGFYEWQKVPGQKAKQPYYVHRQDDEPLAFAGLWEFWRPKPPTGGRGVEADEGTEADEGDEGAGEHADEDGGEVLLSCTILTTSANETMRPLHDRMPVILPPSRWDEWLDPANDDLEALGRLLVPAPADLLTLHPVSSEVNNVRNEGAHLLDPVDPVDPSAPGGQGTLL